MKFLTRGIFLLLVLIFLFNIFAKEVKADDEIMVINADGFWNCDLLAPPSDALDASEVKNPNRYAFLSHIDNFWQADLITPSSDVLDSNDIPSEKFIKYSFVSHADSYRHSDLENPYRPIPIISFSPKNPVKGIEVKFDASKSYSPNGKIIKFEWQIKNVSTSEILSTLNGTNTAFSFPENGDYQITLTVTDEDGANSSISTIIKVEPFSFAIITDLHIGRGYEDYGSSGFDDFGEGEDYYLTERLKNVVQWIIDNRNNIDCEGTKCPIKFLAVLGDIADSGEKSEFLKTKKILDRLNDFGIPYVLVFGNHDVWPYTKEKEAEVPKGEDYFEETFWDENAANTKLMKEILNWQRDESNKKFKNFVFNYGGINFVGLDFNSREKFMGVFKGVGADAVLNEINKNWLKEKLEKFKRTSVVVFAHHPMILDIANAFSLLEKMEIEKILSENFVLFDFAGHIHSFEQIHGKLSHYANANKSYGMIGNANILTTEALMVGSNGRGVEKETEENGAKDGKKGIIRIVKVLDKDNIKPNNWETTETGDEFSAFNPYLNFGFSVRQKLNIPCVEVEAHAFTEKQYQIHWDFGDGETADGIVEKTKCYNTGGKYRITLTLKDPNSNFSESIAKEVEVKEGVIPRTIREIEEYSNQGFEFISENTQMSFRKIGQIKKDIVSIFKKKSPLKPIGKIIVHFEELNDDLDLTGLKADTDLEKQKTILYMENWPTEIERSKVLFLPIK